MNPHTIIIVSGQPRSGTSLMMRLLDESGVPVFAGEKVSYEAKATNTLQSNNDWVLGLPSGTALKVMWPHCVHLPHGSKYKFLWMRRNSREQARSQAKFLGRNKMWRRLAEIQIKKVEVTAPSIIRQGADLLIVRFESLLHLKVHPVEKFLGKTISVGSIISRSPRAGVHRLGSLEAQYG